MKNVSITLVTTLSNIVQHKVVYMHENAAEYRYKTL